MFQKLTDEHKVILADMKTKQRTPAELASVRASLMRGYTIGEAEEKTKSLADRQSKRNTKQKQPVEPQIIDTLPTPQVAPKPKRQSKKQIVQPEAVVPVQAPVKPPTKRGKKQQEQPFATIPEEPVAEAPKPKRGKKQQEQPFAAIPEEPVQSKAKGKAKNSNTVEIIL